MPTTTVIAGETGLSVNTQTFFAWAADNIYPQILAPATLDGLSLVAYFPITGGLVDPPTLTGLVNHGGGLRINKYNDGLTMIENSLDTTNLRFVNGNTLTGDVSGLIPAPTADLINTQITPLANGTIVFEADAQLTAATALVLNTYFGTTVFVAGQILGHLKSKIETRLIARPGSGTPFVMPLVPAYRQCLSPNTTHVEPLDLPACTPATQESFVLTTGTIGQASGRLRLTVMPGDPNTTEDEADIGVNLHATDVRRLSNGTDYTGRTLLSLTLRITTAGGGFTGAQTVTVRDAQFQAPVACTATPGSAGSTCSLETTTDTLLPGFAKEGKRTMMSAVSVELKDAGFDGFVGGESCPPTCETGDELTFLHGGTFLP